MKVSMGMRTSSIVSQAARLAAPTLAKRHRSRPLGAGQPLSAEDSDRLGAAGDAQLAPGPLVEGRAPEPHHAAGARMDGKAHLGPGFHVAPDDAVDFHREPPA